METPYFLYFPQELESNIQEFQKFLDIDVRILYALKSNNYAPLVKRIIKKKWGFDISSKEELFYVLGMGAPPSNLSFSIPSKKASDITEASSKGVTSFVFDSEEEIKKIYRCAVAKPRLFARIESPSTKAAFDLSKFGMSYDYFIYIVKQAKERKWNIEGISFHVGSQNLSRSAWKMALDYVAQLIMETKHYGVNITAVNVGGGIPVQYFPHFNKSDYYVDFLLRQLKAFKSNFPQTTIYIEPGRAISANTMALVSRVINYKPYKTPPMLVLDTGVFHGIIEALEHFEYPIIATSRERSRSQTYQVVGFSCDGYDVINKKVDLPSDTRVGDLLIVTHTGAYTFVYERFHMVPYPRIEVADN